MKKIDLNECHKLLLEIAKEFDRICTKHNIPYYMLGGTMLGAIRHKGFIPWDDDMDFGVPRPYYQKLVDILDKELPNPYKCCTYLNNEAVKSPFIKISNSNTFIDDPRIKLPIENQLGLNIDIFPLDFCDKNDKTLRKIYCLERISQLVYIESTQNNWLKSTIKFILRLLCPFEHNTLLSRINRLAETLEEGKYLGNIFGRWKRKEIIPLEWYGEGIRYRYEDITLCGIKRYDEYLSQMYGNYMELPPIDKREAHVDNVYVK